jgi:hypothetical protein
MIGTSLRRILSRKHDDVVVCTGHREALVARARETHEVPFGTSSLGSFTATTPLALRMQRGVVR